MTLFMRVALANRVWRSFGEKWTAVLGSSSHVVYTTISEDWEDEVAQKT